MPTTGQPEPQLGRASKPGPCLGAPAPADPPRPISIIPRNVQQKKNRCGCVPDKSLFANIAFKSDRLALGWFRQTLRPRCCRAPQPSKPTTPCGRSPSRRPVKGAYNMLLAADVPERCRDHMHRETHCVKQCRVRCKLQMAAVVYPATAEPWPMMFHNVYNAIHFPSLDMVPYTMQNAWALSVAIPWRNASDTHTHTQRPLALQMGTSVPNITSYVLVICKYESCVAGAAGGRVPHQTRRPRYPVSCCAYSTGPNNAFWV